MPQSKPMMWAKYLMFLNTLMLVLMIKTYFNTSYMKKKLPPMIYHYKLMKW